MLSWHVKTTTSNSDCYAIKVSNEQLHSAKSAIECQETIKQICDYYDELLLLVFCWLQNTIVTVAWGIPICLWREIRSPDFVYYTHGMASFRKVSKFGGGGGVGMMVIDVTKFHKYHLGSRVCLNVCVCVCMVS